MGLSRRNESCYLRWRILARIRRFLRPTLRRPLRFFIRLTDLSRPVFPSPQRPEV